MNPTLSIPLRNKRSINSFITLLIVTLLLAVLANILPYNPYSLGMTGAEVNYEVAKVLKVESERIHDSKYQKGLMVGSQELQVKILSGSHRGERVSADNRLTPYNSVVGKEGRYLIVVVDEITSGRHAGRFDVRVYNYFRMPVIIIMASLFFTCLILVGRRKGIMSGLGLIYTFICVFTIFMPLVLRGYSPILSSIILVSIVSATSLIMLNGLSKKSLCCILGTISGVILSGIILMFFSQLMHISGFNTEESETLMIFSHSTGLKVRDLLYSGILIASLGAIMDIAMSVVSSVNEIQQHQPDAGSMLLFRAGMNVGKDVIGTMSNTLILAFTGTSLNFLIILSSYSVQSNQYMNMNRTAIEITQALSGSLALVLTVPITALFASRLLKNNYS